MHSHLAIIGKNGELALNPDQSITITEKNPMFNDVEMFSHTFSLPFNKNRKLLKNMEARDSDMRATDVENDRFRIVLDGLPSHTTVLKVSNDVVLNDSIDVNLDASNRTFKDMIQNMKCRDVTVDDDILVGEKIGDVALHVEYHTEWTQQVYAWRPSPGDQTDPSDQWTSAMGYTHIEEKPKVIEGTFQPPVLGFSYPAKCVTKQDGIEAVASPNTLTIDGQSVITPVADELYINTKTPYGSVDENGKSWKYCNSRICYEHHDREKDGDGNWQTADNLVLNSAATPDDKHNFGSYWVLDAVRPASGICFYVGYFLERLFKDLGMDYDMSDLTAIEDFNYLCFFSTSYKCRTENTSLKLNSIEDINRWLSSRGCGGQLSISFGELNVEIYLKTTDRSSEDYGKYLELTTEEVARCTNQLVMDDVPYNPIYYIKMDNNDGSVGPLVTGNNWPCIYEGWTYTLGSTSRKESVDSQRISACVQKLYATNDNFPEASVSSVIESLENSFGVRFCYDAEKNKVTVRLLRNMFCEQQPPIPFKGKVLSMLKVSEKIKGIKMGYSAESDSREQRDNIRYQKKDYNTTYDYMEYPQGRTFFESYDRLVKLVDIGNMNCYVDLSTGNAFRIKINSEAKTAIEMKPSLFEVGALKGVEIGDCSKENEDYIKEYRSDFEPVICNVLKRNDSGSILLVPFVDENMSHELMPIKIQNVMVVGRSNVYFNYDLKLLENYDPSNTDDGQSPIMSHGWGLTIGILRPGTYGNTIYEFDKNYDGFNNSRWGIASDDYAVTADSYDVKGRFIGVNAAGSFSLKPRAYKPFRFYYDENNVLHVSTNSAEWDDPKWLIPCNSDIYDEQGNIIKRIHSRGMCDTFMIEFFRFLLYRQRYKIKAICTAAELIDIPNHWLHRYVINGKVGFIDVITYSVNEETGIGEVEINFYSM